MGRPKQRILRTARRSRPVPEGFARLTGTACLLLLAGCAQLDQMMGKQAPAGELAQPAQTPTSVTPTTENPPAQAAEPASKPVAKKKSDDAHQSGAVKDSHQQTPSPASAHAPAASTGVGKQPEPVVKQPGQDKAATEKEQPSNEKKARAASDKKKKPAKPQAEPQPPAEDVFLSPVPLPSKPAAIGGSGG
jgi:hypothetical protein